ncbi:MAG: cytochrome c peroxidase [Saprospiraceae bacterium]
MTYTKTGLCLLLGVILQSSCTNKDNSYQLIDIELVSLLKAQSPSGNLSYFELPSSTDLNKIPQDPKNTLTTSKIALGGFLFHETTLGTEGKEPALKQTYSCATCHHYDAGFQSGTLQGYGDGGTGFGVNGELRVIKSNISNPDVQSLRTLSVLNGAFQTNQMWNGQFGSTHVNANTKSLWTETSILKYNNLGFEGLETRSIAGLEMHRMKMTDDIIKMGAYKNLFDDAFQNIPENIRYTNETAGLAIAAYLRTITASEAPFQKYVQGNIDAMNESEKQGAIVFFGKGQCSSCHTGPALNSMQFNALGMNDMIDCPEPTFNTIQNDPSNLGRGGFTKNPSDNYKFKVPQLYNLADSPFYGHGSSFRTIKEVIKYKNMAVPQNKNILKNQIDPIFKPIGLTPEEINTLTAFITQALYDPKLRRFVPQKLPSGLCFPNADLQSRRDMNCF